MRNCLGSTGFKLQATGFKLMACSLCLAATLSSCSPVSKSALTKQFRSIETSLKDHTGFMLYDLEQKKEIYSFQSDRYFTPASNIKIFTFYTGLVVLRDSVPALQYIERGDSLIFRGTGDPSFLYSKAYDSRKSFNFLKDQSKKLFLSQRNFLTTPLGPGWTWDDARYIYSVDRSPFPVYGNYLTIDHTGSSLKISPRPFMYQVMIKDSLEKSDVVRDFDSNKLTFYPGRVKVEAQHWNVPFKTSATLTAELLSDTLKKQVQEIGLPINFSGARVLKSTPADSLYKVMMQESDNFIAEQVLLVCSQVLSDSLKPEIAIRYMKKNHLLDLPDEPRWVDGSGLSRYNLLTPRSIVKLWDKIYKKVPRERLFTLLAIGGKTGTVKNYYKNDPPYIYGKTGTLSNNHSLSGYLITKKGRTFIFCFMSNNYPGSVSTARVGMEKILKQIYDNY